MSSRPRLEGRRHAVVSLIALLLAVSIAAAQDVPPEEPLKTAIRTTVRGEIFPGAGSLGRLDVGLWDVLRDMVASIRAREGELAERAERSLAPYLPAGPSRHCGSSSTSAATGTGALRTTSTSI